MKAEAEKSEANFDKINRWFRSINWKEMARNALPLLSITTIHFSSYIYNFSIGSFAFVDYHSVAVYFLSFTAIFVVSLGISRITIGILIAFFHQHDKKFARRQSILTFTVDLPRDSIRYNSLVYTSAFLLFLFNYVSFKYAVIILAMSACGLFFLLMYHNGPVLQRFFESVRRPRSRYASSALLSPVFVIIPIISLIKKNWAYRGFIERYALILLLFLAMILADGRADLVMQTNKFHVAIREAEIWSRKKNGDYVVFLSTSSGLLSRSALDDGVYFFSWDSILYIEEKDTSGSLSASEGGVEHGVVFRGT